MMYAYITKSKMLKLARKSNVIPQRTLIEVAHQTHEDQRIVSGWMGPNFKLVWLHWCEGVDKEQWYYPTVDSIRYIVKWIPEEALVDRDISIFQMLQTVLQPSYLPSEVTKDIGGRLPRGHTYAMHNVGPFVEHLTDRVGDEDDAILLCVEEIMMLLMHALCIAVILARHGIEMTHRAVFCVRGSGVHIIPVLVQFSGIVYHPHHNNDEPILCKNLLSVMHQTIWNLSWVPEDEDTGAENKLAKHMEEALLEYVRRLSGTMNVSSNACVRSLQEAMKLLLAVYSRSGDKRSYEQAMNRLAAASFSSS